MESRRASAGEKLSQYMRDIGKFPLLSSETELSLCRRWIDHHDISAAHQLANSHLRRQDCYGLSWLRASIRGADLRQERSTNL